jgi:hypothetical protein
MITALERYILDCWNDFCPKHKKPNGLSSILVSNLPSHLDIVTFLIIPEGSSAPLFTAKLPRYIKDNDKIRQKVERVSRLRTKLPVHLSCSFPELVNMVEIADRLIILEKSIPMPTLGLELKRQSKSSLISSKFERLEIIAAWLIDFFQVTRQPATEQSLTRPILNVLEKYENRFLPTPPQKAWLRKTRLLLGQKKNIPYLGVEHTNLTPDHVSFNHRRLYIANWENMGEKGLPLFDAFRFITFLALYEIRKVAEAKDRFRLLVLTERKASELWWSWINKVGGALGIEEPVQKVLYLLYLMNQSLNWEEFETTENFWPQLIDLYVSWLDQIGFSS